MNRHEIKKNLQEKGYPVFEIFPKIEPNSKESKQKANGGFKTDFDPRGMFTLHMSAKRVRSLYKRLTSNKKNYQLLLGQKYGNCDPKEGQRMGSFHKSMKNYGVDRHPDQFASNLQYAKEKASKLNITLTEEEEEFLKDVVTFNGIIPVTLYDKINAKNEKGEFLYPDDKTIIISGNYDTTALSYVNDPDENEYYNRISFTIFVKDMFAVEDFQLTSLNTGIKSSIQTLLVEYSKDGIVTSSTMTVYSVTLENKVKEKLKEAIEALKKNPRKEFYGHSIWLGYDHNGNSYTGNLNKYLEEDLTKRLNEQTDSKQNLKLTLSKINILKAKRTEMLTPEGKPAKNKAGETLYTVYSNQVQFMTLPNNRAGGNGSGVPFPTATNASINSIFGAQVSNENKTSDETPLANDETPFDLETKIDELEGSTVEVTGEDVKETPVDTPVETKEEKIVEETPVATPVETQAMSMEDFLDDEDDL